MKNINVRGVTLVELLATISIVAIMLAIAVPSYRNFVLNNRRATQVNEFVLAMAYAKSETVKRGVRVTVCGRATDTACAGSTTWDNGWLVFVDGSGDGIINGTDTVLLVRAPLEGGNTLRASALQRVTFQDTGFSPGFSDTFRLCDSRGTSQSRAIVVSLQGRVRTQSGTTTCP